jgi:peptide/nickel transport system substrate-binding protein
MRRLVSAFSAVLAAALAACGDPPAAGTFSAGGGSGGAGGEKVLVFARGNDSKSLDPALVTDGESVKVITNVFDTLVRFKPGSLELEPGLATSWSASPDGLTWTFHLREAKFHDGSPVDAEAVVFSFLRQKDEGHPAHTDACAYWQDSFGVVTDVRAVDPRTVEMKLAKPFAPFEAAMALFSMSIVSPKAWASEGKDAKGKFAYRFGEKPVGSGPFRFVRWNREDTIVLEKNPEYWGGAPQVDRVVFRYVKQNQARLLAAEQGQAHIVDGLNPSDVPQVTASGKLELLTQPGLNISYFAMNGRHKPFDDPRVRNAVALAIDKEAIRAAAYDGAGETAATPIPRGMPGWKEIPDRKRDVAKAKALLAEAGLAGGFTFKLSVMDNPRDYMPRPKDVAIQISQDLKAIGVTAEVQVLQWARHLDDTQNGRHEACLLGWMADYGDPDNFLYVLLDKETARPGSSNNASFYTDETVHQWLQAARETTDRAERMRLYGLAQDKIFADAPMVPLVTLPVMRAVSKRVRGYRIYPAGGEYLAGVTLE